MIIFQSLPSFFQKGVKRCWFHTIKTSQALLDGILEYTFISEVLRQNVQDLDYTYAGLHKLWNPAIPDWRLLSKFGEHGKVHYTLLATELFQAERIELWMQMFSGSPTELLESSPTQLFSGFPTEVFSPMASKKYFRNTMCGTLTLL